jgi:hypothetical protein
MATIAVFVALGGTGYAAVRITGKDVKDSSLTGRDVKNSSLTTADVKDRSLRASDFSAGQLPQGEKGDIGPPGQNGADGAPGPGAVDLHFEMDAEFVSGSGVFTFHQLAVVGPWTISIACGWHNTPSSTAVQVQIQVAGPGDYQAAWVRSSDDSSFTNGSGGGSLPASDMLQSDSLQGGGPAAPGHFMRSAATIELHSGTTAATLTLNALADYRSTRKCFGNGTGVLTG